MSTKRNMATEEETEPVAYILDARPAGAVKPLVAFVAGAALGAAFAWQLIEWKVPVTIAQAIAGPRLVQVAPRLALLLLAPETMQSPSKPRPAGAVSPPAPARAPDAICEGPPEPGSGPAASEPDLSMVSSRPNAVGDNPGNNLKTTARRISHALRGFVWSPEKQGLVPAKLAVAP